MKTCLLSFLLVLAAAASTARAQAPSGAAAATLTNASVVKLVRAGFREKTLRMSLTIPNAGKIMM